MTSATQLFDFEKNKSTIKWIVIATALLVSVGSIYYTNLLVKNLKAREKRQVELYAKALEYTFNQSGDSEVYFVTNEILFQNNSIPTILVDDAGNVQFFRNIDLDSASLSPDEITKKLQNEIRVMRNAYEPIEIPNIDEEGNIYAIQKVYYRNSDLLYELRAYPYIQLSVIAFLALVAYLAFNYSRSAEQNRVWVGMAKETAHQLGTPISSLLAWMEHLRENPELASQSVVMDELDKDIYRLELITERFSSIGSAPLLKEENVNDVVENTISYLKPRISNKITINIVALSDEIKAKLNISLFEWVLENLVKNAADAIQHPEGNIMIRILRGSENRIFIDVKDNGRGIPKSNVKNVFNPGYTTKKRGWGLGLALVKRIIENYHQGKIFVKWTEEGVGTTFRIVLPA
ncbi:MAG: sensor histidine kinase [Candidatus Cyclobacteriaceae bacterium M2_1C_046]